MAKLGSIFPSGLRLTQYLHGRYQNGKALDITPIDQSDARLIAPCDVKVVEKYDSAAKTPYIELFNNDFMVPIVHARLVVPAGIYRKGTNIGSWKVPTDRYADHAHIAVKTPKGWGCYYDFVERSTPTAIGYGFRPDQRWMADINSYADLQLAIISLFPEEPKPPVKPPVVPPTNELEKRVKELEKSMTEIFNISKKSING
jgi:hypothetical protein